jgi:hypothetical protein
MTFNVYFKKHKYGAVRSKCSLGHNHPSKLECGYCGQLQLMLKANKIKGFEFQKKYELRVNGKLIGCHKPDFTVTTKEGSIEVHETKGMVTSDFMLRKNLFEAIYPEIPYIVIK